MNRRVQFESFQIETIHIFAMKAIYRMPAYVDQLVAIRQLAAVQWHEADEQMRAQTFGTSNSKNMIIPKHFG